MSIKNKILLLIIFVVILTSIVMQVITTQIILKDYTRIEKEGVVANLLRVNHAIGNDLQQLSIKLTDWARWDDTYVFMKNKNKEYVESNLGVTTLEGLQIDVMGFVNTKSEILHLTVLDPISGNKSDDFEFQKFLQNTKELITFKNPEKTQMVLLHTSRHPLLFVVQPVTTSKGEGPSTGIVFFGKYITAERLQELNTLTQTSFTLYSLQNNLSFEVQKALLQLNKEEKYAVIPESDATVHGYTFFDGVVDGDKFLIKVTMPRKVVAQGKISLFYYFLISSGLGLLSAIVAFWLFNYLVVKRFLRIGKQLMTIGSMTDLSVRITDGGKDEIGNFVKIVNQMLEKLQSSSAANVTLYKRLRDERDKAHAIISSMGQGLVVVNKNGMIEMTNVEAEKLLGISETSVLGKMYVDLIVLKQNGHVIPPSDRPIMKTLHEGVSVRGGIESNYSMSIGASQKEFPVGIATSPLRNEDGIQGAIIIFEDISEEKAVKQRIESLVALRTKELHDEQARLEASINSLRVGFIMTNTKHHIVTMNVTARHMLFQHLYRQMSPMEHIDHLGKQVTWEEVKEQLGKEIDLLQLVTQSFNEKRPIVRNDITLFGKHVNIHITPIAGLTNKLEMLGTVILLQDVTAERVLERSRDEFFSIASHELRTPLTAIMGNTSMIRDMYPQLLEDKNVNEMMSDIYTSSKRLIEIVNDFLDMSRLEQGKMHFSLEPCSPMEVMESSITKIQGLAQEKNLTLAFEPPAASLPMVMADKGKLQEILINLIGNAIKYSDKGIITIRIHQHNAIVKFTIEDTGRGISNENKALIFKKFQQATDNILTRDSTRGSGLGLYIAKLMVEGMGGTISLERSEVGKGSVFAFVLPIVKQLA